MWFEDAVETNQSELSYLTAEIVSAYVANNSVRIEDLPRLISATLAALAGMDAPSSSRRPVPAVPIKKSITSDHLISLEDGKHYKSLKRHLANRGMTPHDYRVKWGLQPDYPMVAPNYAKRRSELAKALGLGGKSAVSKQSSPKQIPTPISSKPTKGRAKKPPATAAT